MTAALLSCCPCKLSRSGQQIGQQPYKEKSKILRYPNYGLVWYSNGMLTDWFARKNVDDTIILTTDTKSLGYYLAIRLSSYCIEFSPIFALID